jgi:hypothetical protein
MKQALIERSGSEEGSMSGDQDKSEPAERILPRQLIIEAELLDTGEPAPRPGEMYLVSLMRYKVLADVQGRYPHRFILVGHHLPDLGSPEFRIGVRQRLQLTREFPPHATLLDKFAAESREIGCYFCSSFQVLH